MHRRPENLAAVVNGLVVLLLPFAVAAVWRGMGFGESRYSVTIHAQGWVRFLETIRAVIGFGKLTLPFAVLAAWRTWVHSTRRRDRGERGWQGVAEAGACGLGTALLILLPGIVTHPIDTAPYVVVCGGAALVVGLVTGLLLRTSALAVLKLTGSAS